MVSIVPYNPWPLAFKHKVVFGIYLDHGQKEISQLTPEYFRIAPELKEQALHWTRIEALDLLDFIRVMSTQIPENIKAVLGVSITYPI